MKKRQDGQLILAIGISRSGKSLFVKHHIQKKGKNIRLAVFDPKREYATVLTPSDSIAHFYDYARNEIADRLCLTDCNKKTFQQFCRIVRNWNRIEPCLCIVEELPGYTNQGKAVGHWNTLINQALGEGMTVIATAQRASEIDKTTFGNATYLHIAQQQIELDRQYIAKNTTLQDTDIPREPLQWVQWQSGIRKLGNGTITFVNKKPKFNGSLKN